MKHPSALRIHRPVLKDHSLVCSFSYGDETFTNSYLFPAPLLKTYPEIAGKIAEWVALTSALGLFSVDYFNIVETDFSLSKSEVHFFEKLFFLGLAEFRFVNKIPMAIGTRIIPDAIAPEPGKRKRTPTAYRLNPFLLNGGGKDGSASALMLQESGIDFTWFQRGDSQAQKNVVGAWDYPSFVVQRRLDSKRKGRKFAGHRPMSAGIAFIAILSAVLFGYSDVIASNEASASEGNFSLDGVEINHQYSKSLAFEKDLKQLLEKYGVEVRYFSLLRSMNELQIAVLDSNLNSKQLRAITSCNNGTRTGKWCMNCAKCAFVALTVTAADSGAAKQMLDGGTINKPALMPHLEALLSPQIDKPLECVGTVEECQVAAGLILRNNRAATSSELTKLLEAYARSEPESVIKASSKDLVPIEYSGTLKVAKRHIKNWAVKNY